MKILAITSTHSYWKETIQFANNCSWRAGKYLADIMRNIKNSDNYYVIATRSSLFHLPYSIQEIHSIKNKAGNRYQRTNILMAQEGFRLDLTISYIKGAVIAVVLFSVYLFILLRKNKNA